MRRAALRIGSQLGSHSGVCLWRSEMATGHPKGLHWQVDTLDWSSWYPGSMVLNGMVHLGDSHPLGQWVAARRTGEPITWSSLSQCSLFKSQGSTTALRFAEPTSRTEDDAIHEPNWANCGQKQGGKAPSLGGKMVIRSSKSRVGQCRALNKLSVRKEKLKSRVTEHGPPRPFWGQHNLRRL